MDVIDVVPHLRDRHTVMSLLKAEPAPVRAHVSRPLREGSGYRFTATDVAELIAERRADLAELVLEGTIDVNVLYAMTSMPAPVPVLKAVCRNPRAPGDLLAYLYCDKRKGVAAAARSALAGHLGVMVRSADAAIAKLCEVIYCPDEDLAPALASVLQTRHLRTVDYFVACALERPGLISEEAWSLIVGTDWGWIANFASHRALAALVRHPRMSVEDLESILARARFRGPRGIVVEALLDRLEPGSDRWLELVAGPESSYPGTALGERARCLASDQVRELFARGGPWAYAIASAGLAGNDETAALARRWATAPSMVRFPVQVLAHPAVSGPLLARCMDTAATMTAARPALAANPWLTPEMEVALAADHLTRLVLAANPSLSARGAEAVMHHALGLDLPGRSAPEYLPWRAQGPLMALLANAGLPDKVRLGVPAVAAVRPQHDTHRSIGPAVAFLDERFGHDPDRWKSFLGLLGEWEGTLGDLVQVVTVL